VRTGSAEHYLQVSSTLSAGAAVAALLHRLSEALTATHHIPHVMQLQLVRRVELFLQRVLHVKI
jgi:hypothetical protein